MTNGAGKVVDEVVRRNIPLHLAGVDGLATRLIGPRAERGVIHADNGLHIVSSGHGFGHSPNGRTAIKRLALRHLLALGEHQVGMAASVRCFPVRVGVKRTFFTNERNTRRKGNHLCRLGAPVVEHPLGIHGVVDKAAEIPLALDVDFLAIDRNDGDVLPRPFILFQNLRARHDALRNLVALRLAAVHNLNAHGVKQVFGREVFLLA